MALSSAQLSALQAAITADAALTTLNTANGFQQIADALNLASSPAVSVWIPNLSTSTMLSAILAADMPTAAGLIGYLQMMLAVGTVDTTQANVRTSFSTIFAAKQSLTNLAAIAQRTGTRFESLAAFITAAGAASVSSVYGIRLAAFDVQQAVGKG